MRRVVAAACVLVLLAGCEKSRQDKLELTVESASGPSARESNRWMVESVENAQVRNALIAQRTIYAYHFVPGSATLSELGQRDLDVLADYFKQYAGTLNVQQADAPRELYDQRVATVMESLQRTGLDTSRVRVADGAPGGEGMTADRVIIILRLPAKVGESTGYVPQLEWKEVPK